MITIKYTMKECKFIYTNLNNSTRNKYINEL